MPRQKEMIPANLIKLSPSSFSFDWKDCRRCYWLKHRAGVVRPSKPMASIYTKIDSAMRAYYHGKPIILDGIEMVLDTKVRALRSAPFFVEGLPLGVFISGKNDALAFPTERAEGDVDWCRVPDFKTAEPKPENVARYGTQLGGYAYCLEHPADPEQAPIEVRGTDLICFVPMAYEDNVAEVAGSRKLTGLDKVLPMPRDRAGFERFLTDVVVCLNGPVPVFNQICAFCEMDRETERLQLEVVALRAPTLEQAKAIGEIAT